MNSFRRASSLLICLAGILGFSFTTYTTIKSYLAYDTIAFTSSETLEHFSLPVMSYAASLENACPDLKRETIDFYDDISEMHPNQIFERCFKFSDVVSEISYLSSDLKWRSLKLNTSEFEVFSQNNVSTYIFDNRIHFEFELADATEYNSIRVKYSNQYYSRNRLFMTKANVGKGRLISLQYKDSEHQMMRRDDLKSTRVPPDVIIRNSVVDRIRYKRLPTPYNTNCFSYDESAGYSRFGCYDKCIDSHYLEVYGKASPFSKIKPNSDLKVAFNVTEPNNLVRQTCEAKCSKSECEEVFYHPNHFSNENSIAPEIRMINQEYKEFHLPKVTLLEVILNVLGNAGFWFGCSLCRLSTTHILPLLLTIASFFLACP